MKADLWKDRGMKMKCESCIYYIQKAATQEQIEDERVIGRCRRRAPTLNGYPVVFPSDWCGDHKLNEN